MFSVKIFNNGKIEIHADFDRYRFEFVRVCTRDMTMKKPGYKNFSG